MALAYTYFPPQYFPPDYFGDLTDSGIKTASAFGAVRITAQQPTGLRNPVRSVSGSVVIRATAEGYAFIGGAVYRNGMATGDVRVLSQTFTAARVITSTTSAQVIVSSQTVVGSKILQATATQSTVIITVSNPPNVLTVRIKQATATQSTVVILSDTVGSKIKQATVTSAQVVISSQTVVGSKILQGVVQVAPLVIYGFSIEFSIKTQAAVGSIQIVSVVNAVASGNGVAVGSVVIQPVGPISADKLKIGQPVIATVVIRSAVLTVRVRTVFATATVAIHATAFYGQGYTQPIGVGTVQIVGAIRPGRTITSTSVVTVAVVGTVSYTTLKPSHTYGMVSIIGFSRSASSLAGVRLSVIQVKADVYGGLVYRIRKPLSLGVSNIGGNTILDTIDTHQLISCEGSNDLELDTIDTHQLISCEGSNDLELVIIGSHKLSGSEGSNDVEVNTMEVGTITGTYTRKGVRANEDD